ncbi:MAG TPA: CDP-alcohol phosphatidyltransferase family protein [Longimicrobiales bacterium]|nr:CDP-alcohol phosphatidyltransferase family protein [Longimicrobiales bacterium]
MTKPARVGAWPPGIPNLLSLARLPLAAAFLLVHSTTARVAIITLAAASDYLDGWWARNRGPRTRTGELLDPFTDKVFIVTALVAFAAARVITAVELLVLLARDLFVTVGFIAVLALRTPVRLRSRFPGKVVTTLQIAAILILTLAPGAARLVVLATLAASAWAMADYTAAGLRQLRDARGLRAPPGPR